MGHEATGLQPFMEHELNKQFPSALLLKQTKYDLRKVGVP